MEEWQKRVVAEKVDLDDKIDKLQIFIDGPTYGSLDSSNKALLLDQLGAMVDYSNALRQRINLFN